MSNEAKLKQQLKQLSDANKLHMYKIRAKKLKTSGYSLYLDRRSRGRNEYITLNLYLTEDDPNTNKVNIRKAITYRDRVESNTVDTALGLKSVWKKKSNILPYARELSEKRDRRWNAMILDMEKFSGGPLAFEDIDNKWVEGFRDYLLEVHTNNTASSYFNCFRAMLNNAIRDEITDKMPGKGVSIKEIRPEREFVTFEEIKAISAVDIFPAVRDAFIFGCYTGLRISDIERLTWDKVSDGHLSITQVKTREVLRNKLPRTALQVLDRQDRSRDLVFALPASRTSIANQLNMVMVRAGITRKITFHISRHTFAVMQLIAGVELYTVSKLLGHTDIKTTQIYAKVIDLVKDNAVDKFSQMYDLDLDDPGE